MCQLLQVRAWVFYSTVKAMMISNIITNNRIPLKFNWMDEQKACLWGES